MRWPCTSAVSASGSRRSASDVRCRRCGAWGTSCAADDRNSRCARRVCLSVSYPAVMNPDVLRVAQLLALAGMFGTLVTGLVIVARFANARLRAMEQRTLRSAPAEDDRLQRLEQAVDSIAIEIERIS